MSWQTLVIIIMGTLVALTVLGMLSWSSSRWLNRYRIRQLETQLVDHLRSVGVRAEERKDKVTLTRTREDEYAVILRHLVTIRVWLSGIHSIEIWRITRKRDNESSTLHEMTFVIAPESGMSLSRIPILTNIVKTHATKGRNGFQWRGFEWGRLPLLVDRLKVDTDLHNRLLEYFESDLPAELRITALDRERIGITTGYSPQQLPSRAFVACIEDIAKHIHDYVAERNVYRELQNRR
jgi:hypothetical protein